MIDTEKLQNLIDGDVETGAEVLDEHSRDTSLFEVRPEVVVFPKSVKDVEAIVRFVNENKADNPNLSLTGRAAGTDMSGGPLNESIILSFTRYFNTEDVDENNLTARIEPGVYYRDFEKETLPKHLTMPAYPASKSLAAFGGMIMNNCAGEKTLRYGKMVDFVDDIDVTLADGNTYSFNEINLDELEEKKAQDNFEGELYRKMHALLENNYDVIKAARPDVSKNSAGYALWDVYDREAGTFDLTKLFVGSQGTLGMWSSANIRLMHEKPHERMVALFFKNWSQLPAVVNALLPHDPESLETFDDETLKLGLRFMPEVAKRAGTNFLSFALNFLPEAWIGVKMLGLPRLIVLVELAEETRKQLDEKTAAVEKGIEQFDLYSRTLEPEDAEKYWIMRRQSFALLREHVGDKKTAPFIDDFCIKPEVIPEFLPQALDILESHDISVNIAGHAGNGNFHIIPLMDLKKESERAKIPTVANEFYKLVNEYGGSITAEHNDGIVRTPYLEGMYGAEICDLFRQTKEIFDPYNIFNPGKKVGGTLEYMKEHIARQ